MCYDSLRVMRPTRPLYFMLNLAGSGHDFRGVCFSVAYTTPNGKSCRTFPKTRSIYHNSRCTPPLKRPQSLSGAKNAKRQENTRLNQKNAPESFLDGCITMHESDPRSVLCVLNTERVKMTRFLSLNGAFYTEIFVPLSIILITGFPSWKQDFSATSFCEYSHINHRLSDKYRRIYFEIWFYQWQFYFNYSLDDYSCNNQSHKLEIQQKNSPSYKLILSFPCIYSYSVSLYFFLR